MLEQAMGSGSDLNDIITVRGGHTLDGKQHACVRDHVSRPGHKADFPRVDYDVGE
jgi:hypothetical protein